MRRIAFCLLGALAVAAGVAGGADAKPGAPVEIWQTAEVEIQPDGRVSTVRWLDDRPAARLVIDRIEPHLRRWQFEPGMIDGTPQVTRTFVRTQLFAEARGRDVALRIGRVSTGPHATHKVIPRYPTAAALAGVSAKVTAVISVTPDGSVAFESLEFWRPGQRAGKRDEFVEATRSALSQWKYMPERVGGREIALQVRIPVEFCAPEQSCEKLFRRNGDGAGSSDERSGEPVALNSATRVLTPVEGAEV